MRASTYHHGVRNVHAARGIPAVSWSAPLHTRTLRVCSGPTSRLRLLQAGCSKPGVALQSHASTREQPAGPGAEHRRLQQLVGDWLRAAAAAAAPSDTAAGQQQPLSAVPAQPDAPIQDLDTLADVLQQLQQADATWWQRLPARAAGEGSHQEQTAAQQQLVVLLEAASCNLQQLRGEALVNLLLLAAMTTLCQQQQQQQQQPPPSPDLIPINSRGSSGEAGSPASQLQGLGLPALLQQLLEVAAVRTEALSCCSRGQLAAVCATLQQLHASRVLSVPPVLVKALWLQVAEHTGDLDASSRAVCLWCLSQCPGVPPAAAVVDVVAATTVSLFTLDAAGLQLVAAGVGQMSGWAGGGPVRQELTALVSALTDDLAGRVEAVELSSLAAVCEAADALHMQLPTAFAQAAADRVLSMPLAGTAAAAGTDVEAAGTVLSVLAGCRKQLGWELLQQLVSAACQGDASVACSFLAQLANRAWPRAAPSSNSSSSSSSSSSSAQSSSDSSSFAVGEVLDGVLAQVAQQLQLSLPPLGTPKDSTTLTSPTATSGSSSRYTNQAVTETGARVCAVLLRSVSVACWWSTATLQALVGVLCHPGSPLSPEEGLDVLVAMYRQQPQGWEQQVELVWAGLAASGAVNAWGLRSCTRLLKRALKYPGPLPTAPPALLACCMQQLPHSGGAEAGELLTVLLAACNVPKQRKALGEPALLAAVEACASEVQTNWSQLRTHQLYKLLQALQSAKGYLRHEERQGWATPFTHAWWRAVSLQVEDVAGWMSAKQLHYTVWALARLGMASGPAVSALAAQSLQLQEDIPDSHLAKLLTAFALLKHQRPVTLALCRAAADRLAQYGPLPAVRGASMPMAAMTATGSSSTSTTSSSTSTTSSSSKHSANSTAGNSTPGDPLPASLSSSAAAIEATAASPQPAADTPAAAAAAAAAAAPSTAPSRSSSPTEGDDAPQVIRGRVLWCCATLGYRGLPQLRGLVNGILSAPGDTPPHVVGWVAWSAARLQLGSPAVLQWCEGRMDWAAARPSVAADTVWGLWKMGYQPSPAFLQQLLFVLDGQWGELRESLSPLLFCLAQWRAALSPTQQAAAVAAVETALPALDAPAVCSTCWALVRLGCQLPPDLTAAAASYLEGFTPTQPPPRGNSSTSAYQQQQQKAGRFAGDGSTGSPRRLRQLKQQYGWLDATIPGSPVAADWFRFIWAAASCNQLPGDLLAALMERLACQLHWRGWSGLLHGVCGDPRHLSDSTTWPAAAAHNLVALLLLLVHCRQHPQCRSKRQEVLLLLEEVLVQGPIQAQLTPHQAALCLCAFRQLGHVPECWMRGGLGSQLWQLLPGIGPGDVVDVLAAVASWWPSHAALIGQQRWEQAILPNALYQLQGTTWAQEKAATAARLAARQMRQQQQQQSSSSSNSNNGSGSSVVSTAGAAAGDGWADGRLRNRQRGLVGGGSSSGSSSGGSPTRSQASPASSTWEGDSSWPAIPLPTAAAAAPTPTPTSASSLPVWQLTGTQCLLLLKALAGFRRPHLHLLSSLEARLQGQVEGLTTQQLVAAQYYSGLLGYEMPAVQRQLQQRLAQQLQDQGATEKTAAAAAAEGDVSAAPSAVAAPPRDLDLDAASAVQVLAGWGRFAAPVPGALLSAALRLVVQDCKQHLPAWVAAEQRRQQQQQQQQQQQPGLSPVGGDVVSDWGEPEWDFLQQEEGLEPGEAALATNSSSSNHSSSCVDQQQPGVEPLRLLRYTGVLYSLAQMRALQQPLALELAEVVLGAAPTWMAAHPQASAATKHLAACLLAASVSSRSSSSSSSSSSAAGSAIGAASSSSSSSSGRRNPWSTLAPGLRQQLLSHWRHVVAGHAAAAPERVVLALGAALQELGVGQQLQAVLVEGCVMVDALVTLSTGEKLAVELVGAHNSTINSQRAMGVLRMKQRLLAGRGVRLALLNCWEWQRLWSRPLPGQQLSPRAAYLERRLLAALPADSEARRQHLAQMQAAMAGAQPEEQQQQQLAGGMLRKELVRPQRPVGAWVLRGLRQ